MTGQEAARKAKKQAHEWELHFDNDTNEFDAAGHIYALIDAWESDRAALVAERDELLAERDAQTARPALSIEAADSLLATIAKLARNAETVEDELAQAVAERDRYRDAVEEAEARLGLMPTAIRQETLRAFERHALAAYRILRAALAAGESE